MRKKWFDNGALLYYAFLLFPPLVFYMVYRSEKIPKNLKINVAITTLVIYVLLLAWFW